MSDEPKALTSDQVDALERLAQRMQATELLPHGGEFMTALYCCAACDEFYAVRNEWDNALTPTVLLSLLFWARRGLAWPQATKEQP